METEREMAERVGTNTFCTGTKRKEKEKENENEKKNQGPGNRRLNRRRSYYLTAAEVFVHEGYSCLKAVRYECAQHTK